MAVGPSLVAFRGQPGVPLLGARSVCHCKAERSNEDHARHRRIFRGEGTFGRPWRGACVRATVGAPGSTM